MTALAESKPVFEIAGKSVLVAGHRGMVGSAIVRRLEKENAARIITATRQEVDLVRQDAVEAWIDGQKPDLIILAAAKVGGILANDTYPAEFLYQNLMIESNVIHAAHTVGVKKLMLLGSSCIYPRLAAQPIVEDALLSGPLEQTNEWYAVAKIAGIKLCQAYRKQHGDDFIAAMPTNLYGPGDNYDAASSHVIPALIRKAHEAKLTGQNNMKIWGTGKPFREFLHSDDCADAIVFLTKHYSGTQHVNVGSGTDLSIADLAYKIMKVVGFEGGLETDPGKPDGTPRKLMSSDKLRNLGWAPSIDLDAGLKQAYRNFLSTCTP